MVRPGVSEAQASAWSLAAGLAGRSRVRVARFNGRRGRWEYPRTREVDLTADIPREPAAVLLYNSHGFCRTLALDVDVEGTEGAALTHRLVALLQRCGGSVIVDRSPAGRHHVYLPLRDGLSAVEAAELARAVARRFPGVDAQPHVTGAESGCIRPPGSVHKRGGFQELVTDLDTARRVLLVRNGSDVLGALRRVLSEEIAQIRRDQMALAAPAPVDAVDSVDALPLGGQRVLSERMARLAQSGAFEEAGYRSASEGRMAVICAAARAGLDFGGIVARMEDGRWPGLAAMFHNVSGDRHSRLGKELVKAQKIVAATPRPTSVRQCNTSAAFNVTRGAGTGRSAREIEIDEHRFIRRWRAVLAEVERSEFAGSRGVHVRLLLRALAAAAHQVGSRHVSFGVRSLSVSMPVDASTVARLLEALRESADPWIVQVKAAEGVEADVYELRIPERHRALAERVELPAGKVHALRPVFVELGAAAALVFEAIERGASSVLEASRRSGISRSTAHEVVGMMRSWGLVEIERGRLVARPDRLDVVAERVGAVAVVAEVIRRHRHERALWRAWLSGARGQETQAWWVHVLEAGPPDRWAVA